MFPNIMQQKNHHNCYMTTCEDDFDTMQIWLTYPKTRRTTTKWWKHSIYWRRANFYEEVEVACQDQEEQQQNEVLIIK